MIVHNYIIMESQSIQPDDIITESNYTEALKVALLHRRVTIVGYNELKKKQQNERWSSGSVSSINEIPKDVQVCLCCGKFSRETINTNFNLQEIGFLGAGYALYFGFQQLCITLLFVLYSIVISYEYIYKWICRKLFGRRGTFKWVDQNDFLCLLVFLNCLFVIILYSIYMVRLRIIVDENDTSPQDYSVLVKNVGVTYQKSGTNIEEQLTNFFEQHFQKKLKVAQTCMCYNLVPLMTIQKKKQVQIEDLKQYYRNRDKRLTVAYMIFQELDLPYEGIRCYHGINDDSQRGAKLRKMKHIQNICKQKIQDMNKIINKGYNNNDLMFIGQMIVSFETQQMAEYVLQHSKNVYFYGNQLEFIKAEHPKGVYWFNLHLDESDYRLRNIFSFISCSSIFLSSLFLQVGLNYLKDLTQGTRFESSIFKFLTTIIINIINIIIPSWILKFFSDFEGHRTRGEEMLSFSRKCIFLQLMNTLVVPLLIMYWQHVDQTFFQKQNGVMFRNALISVIILMISPRCILKQISIFAYERGYNVKGVLANMITVKQLCQMYEYPPFQIDGRYSDILKTILLTFIFGSESQKIILYAIVSFFFSYWIDKYNLARKRSVKYNVNALLNTELSSILLLIVPFFIFTQMCLTNRTVFKILLFITSITLYFRPFHSQIIKWAKRDKVQVGKHMTYTQCQQSVFETDYRRQNPALRGEQRIKFSKLIRTVYQSSMLQLNKKKKQQ